MYVLPVCMYVCHMRTVPTTSAILELELWVVMSHRVGSIL